MKIIGLDLSFGTVKKGKRTTTYSGGTGIAQWHDGTTTCHTVCGRGDTVEDRIADLWQQFWRCHWTNDDPLVVMEAPAFGARFQAHQMGGLQYYFRIQMRICSVPFVVVPPMTLKKFVTGSGKADKNVILREVYKRWGITAENDNEADAVGLVYIGAALKGLWSPETAYQREVVEKLKAEMEGK